MIAGTADQIVQTRAFSPENDYRVGREIKSVVILGAALIQTHAPEALILQGFQGAHQIYNSGKAQMLSSSGGGFDGNRA